MPDKHERTATFGCSWSSALLLTMLFAILKLAHFIDWTWGWILSPLWMFAAFQAILFVILVIALALCEMAEKSR